MAAPSLVRSLACATLALWSFASAQSALRLPGCETDPTVARTLQDELNQDKLDRMPWRERMAFERGLLEKLIAEHPRELEPYTTLANVIRDEDPDEYPALRAQRIAYGKQHPDDPLAVLLQAQALIGRDTPQSMRLLEQLRAQSPGFPWPALTLAEIDFNGARADEARGRQNLEAFYRACPTSTDPYAQWLLTHDAPLGQQVDRAVAAKTRLRLENETDPKQLQDYSDLWSREFRIHPPQEHGQVRAQIAADVRRMQSLRPKGDAAFQVLRSAGLKQSGADDAAVAAAEDRLLREYPHSNEAFRIVRTRWSDAHKEPEDQTDAAAWAAYRKQHREAIRGWIAAYPDDAFLQRAQWFLEIAQDDAVPASETLAAVDTYLRSVQTYDGPAWSDNHDQFAANVLVDRELDPKRALLLLHRVRDGSAKQRAREAEDDNRSPKQVKDSAENRASNDQEVDGLILRAAMQAHAPSEAARLRPEVEAKPPESKKLLSGYWANRARLAALDRHPDDALADYQKAMQARTEPPQPYGGKLKDDLADEAHNVWKAQGRSELSWVSWKQTAAGASDAAAGEGRWEKPDKALPAFELADLSGKTWRMKDLGGKVVLINMWATWCGPCQAELPHLQRLYDKYKNLADLQILTLNMDENLGLVEPFLQKKGYTFPVLPMYQTSVPIPPGIPQNWIVDTRGLSRWSLLGYGPSTDREFENDIMARVREAGGAP